MWALAFIAVTSISGCGGGGAEGGVAVYEASGTVTLFGNPLEGASVAFAPTAKGQPTAMGKTDAEGKFVLSTYGYEDGAAEGTYKIVISKSAPLQPQSGGGDGEGHEAAEGDASAAHAAGSEESAPNMVPQQYTSSKTTTLQEVVTKDGENVFNLVLE